MADIPFIIQMQESVGSNSTATLSYQVATNEQFIVKQWRQESTGLFDINRIYDSAGNNYSNASTTEPIDGQLIKDIDDQFNGIDAPPMDLTLKGGTTIYFDVKDLSAATNVVNIFLMCIRKTGQ